MHGIDVGQPTLCRGIDFLSLISSHSLSERSRNDELRQISDTGAPVWSCDNPPSLRCNRSWGGTPRTTAHRRCLAGLWLMHSSVLFLFVLTTSMSLVGILWLFANTADASAYTCHFFFSSSSLVSCKDRCHNAWVFWHDLAVSYSDGNRATRFPPEIQEIHEPRKWAVIRSQRVGMCCALLIRLLFIIMLQTAKSVLHLRHMLVTHGLLTALHLQLSCTRFGVLKMISSVM